MRQTAQLYRKLKCYSCGSFGHKAEHCYYPDIRKRKHQEEEKQEEKEREEESPKKCAKAMMARANVFDKSHNGGDINIANSR